MIGRISMGAAAAIPFFNEFAQAQQSEQAVGRRVAANRVVRAYDPEMVVISSNENPMGPSK
jgi:hypothetical protein